MSWDISVFAAEVPPLPVAEMPEDWRGQVLGEFEDVRRKISECLSDVDWSDPTWGIYEGNGFSLEFNMGDMSRQELCDGFMIHVRGGGEAVSALIQLASRWGWYLLDYSHGEWLHHCEDVEAGWNEFQAYRDRVLQQHADNVSRIEGFPPAPET